MEQRRLRLMIAQPLLNNINKAIDIAKMQAFLGGELELPADALFGKERGPATLPGVRLGSRGKVIVKIQTKLRLIAPLMQMGDLLA